MLLSKAELLVRKDLLFDNLGSEADSTNPLSYLADIGDQNICLEVLGVTWELS